MFRTNHGVVWNVFIQIYISWCCVTGEVGGYMGLLIGASILTILEIVDLVVYNLFLRCVERLQKKTAVSQATVPANKATVTANTLMSH